MREVSAGNESPDPQSSDPQGGRDDEMRAQLAAIVDSSFDAIVSKTLDGVITFWNHSAEQLFGYTAAEAVGQYIFLIIPPSAGPKKKKKKCSPDCGVASESNTTVEVHKPTP